jgi:hypothetical protein
MMDPFQLGGTAAAAASAATDLHLHQHFYQPHPQLQQSQQEVPDHHPSYFQPYFHHQAPPPPRGSVDVSNSAVGLGSQDDSNELRVFPVQFDPANRQRDGSNDNLPFGDEDPTSNSNPFLD